MMAPSPTGDITMKTVLLTAATGNIGQKLRENLEATGKYALRLLCLDPGNNPADSTADLHLRSGPDRRVRWCRYSAATSRRIQSARWARIRSRNIDLMLNVLQQPNAPRPARGVRQLLLRRSGPVASALVHRPQRWSGH